MPSAFSAAQRPYRILEGYLRIGSVQLIEKNAFGAESFETRFAASFDPLGTAISSPLSTGPGSPHFGRDGDVSAIDAVQCRLDESFSMTKLAVVERVRVGRVDEVDASLDGLSDEIDRLVPAGAFFCWRAATPRDQLH